jgi:hypothetical protein
MPDEESTEHDRYFLLSRIRCTLGQFFVDELEIIILRQRTFPSVKRLKFRFILVTSPIV